jgi:Zn-dependent protease with chaperone function
MTLLPEGHLAPVPKRNDLLDRLARANRHGLVWIAIQLTAFLVVMWLVNWHQVVSQPVLSAVVVGLVVGPTALEIFRLWAQPKKEISHLKEETRFGVFDKRLLRELQLDTLRRLALADKRVPVYITADRSMNASALRLGLGAIFRQLNGIYLHRQVLHKLSPEEVQDIMGHELGHYYRYYLISDRFRPLTVALGGGAGLLVAQWTGMNELISLFASAACAAAFFKLSSIPWARNGETIEYLCDDFGAQVHGVHTSINGLLKLGLDAELQLAIQHQTIFSKKSGSLGAGEIVEIIQSAIPYGYHSKAELDLAVRQAIRQRAEKSQQLSLGGFIKYAWQSDSQAEINEKIEQQVKDLQQLQSLPRIAWESLLPDPSQVNFQDYQLETLLACIESQPHSVLFRIPDELGITDGVHPPLRSRIRYLWYNRMAIDSAASARS